MNPWREALRRKCHVQIAEQGSHPHGAFLHLAEVGDKTTVPLLIAALRWQEAPTEHEGQKLVDCTTVHCLEALEALTGESFGFDPDRWEKWWKETGRDLAPEHFRPRATTRAPADAARKDPDPRR